ncbi:MAG: hypothetical protein K0Q87_2613 [Neobacillus sp.]|nr:hypothetical protein [Neobacillus sp.]
MNQYYLTEWAADTKSDDVIIHIYTIPLVEENTRHSFGGGIAYDLSKENGYQTIIFYEQYIASYEKIHNWRDKSFLKYECRTIRKESSVEKKLLERLIKRELENNAREQYVMDKGAFRLKKPKSIRTNEFRIYPAIDLSVTVEESGDIIMGFDYKHRFEYTQSIDQIIMKDQEAIKKGTRLVDPTNKKTHEYLFKEIAPYKAGDESPFLKESVINYYRRIKKEWKIKGITNESMVVHVETKQGQIFPYLPNLLKISCSLEQLPTHLKNIAIKEIKLSPHEKMTELLNETTKILSYTKYLKFSKRNVLVNNLGYNVKYVENPVLRFGNDVTSKNINQGFQNGGIFSGKAAKVSFFVDPVLQLDPYVRKQVGLFLALLTKESAKLGVKLEVSLKPQGLRGKLDNQLFNSNELPLELKSIGGYFEGTVIVLTAKGSTENAYRSVKKEFGGRQDIVTQFVEFDEKLLDLSKSKYSILNILLGIYVKSGLQPWVLGENLSSDCFIGLDVSHENGRHSSGIILRRYCI